MPKPEKFTKEQVAEAMRKSHGLISIASEILRCSDETIRTYAKRYAMVRDEIAHQRSLFVDIGEQKLWEAVNAGDPWAVTMLLKTLGKDRGYREGVEVTGKDGAAIEIKAFNYGNAIASIAARPMDDSVSSGEDQSDMLRAPLGKNSDGG